MRIAMEVHSEVSKSILYGTAKKQIKKRSKKWCFDFWNVPKVNATF